MHLDFNSGGQFYYRDSSANDNPAVCTSGDTCPRSGGQSGPFGYLGGNFALKLDGNAVINANVATPDDFTAAYWVLSAPGANNSAIVLDQGANVNNGWTMSFDQGRAAFLSNTIEYLVIPFPSADNPQNQCNTLQCADEISPKCTSSPSLSFRECLATGERNQRSTYSILISVLLSKPTATVMCVNLRLLDC